MRRHKIHNDVILPLHQHQNNYEGFTAAAVKNANGLILLFKQYGQNLLHNFSATCASIVSYPAIEGRKRSAYTCLDKLGYIHTFLKCLTAEETVQYFGISQEEAIAKVLESGEDLRYEVANIALEQEMTDNEAQEWINWEDLLAIGNKWEAENKLDCTSDILDVILYRLYTYDHPPRRLEYLRLRKEEEKITELTTAQSSTVRKKGNYLIDRLVVLNVYKTASIYGSYQFKLSNRTSELVALAMNDNSDSPYLFGTVSQVEKESWASAKLQEVFHRICGKKLSCNMLRKIYITYRESSHDLFLAKERVQLAKQMGHSVKTQLFSYPRRQRVDAIPKRAASPTDLEARRPKRASPQHMTKEQREALLSVKEVWYDQPSGSVSYDSLLDNTNEAPSGRTLQAIFSGYDNKNMKQWISTLRKHMDQELNTSFS